MTHNVLTRPGTLFRETTDALYFHNVFMSFLHHLYRLEIIKTHFRDVLDPGLMDTAALFAALVSILNKNG
jgi:hypothetical protein